MIHFFRRFRATYRALQLQFEDRRLESVDLNSTILSRHPADLPARQSKKLCLFAHYDPSGKIANYVMDHCAALKSNGYDIILISTSPSLENSEIERGSQLIRRIIHRRNAGYDFVSWRIGMTSTDDFSQYDELLLTNDSIFGPFSDLSNIFAKIEASSYLVSGLTDNWEKCYHLQSFFIHFKKPAIHSDTFKRFWDNVRMRADKETIIISYEVGLSQAFIRDGYSLNALFPFHEVRDKCIAMGDKFQYRDRILRQPVNSTIFMWDILLKDFGFPYIKTELLKINRFQSMTIPQWRNLIPEDFKPAAQKCEDFLKLGHENCRI